MVMRSLREPLRIGTYRRLLVDYAINALGTWAGQIALSVLVLARTHSPLATSAVMIVGLFVPSLLAPVLVARLEPFGAQRTLPVLLALEALLFALAGRSVAGGAMTVILTLIAIDGLLALAVKAILKAGQVSLVLGKGGTGRHNISNQRAQPVAVGAAASLAHRRDDLLDGGRRRG
jgi:hypothetical protein